MQVVVSVTGIVTMSATAALLDWYKKIEGRTRGGREPGAKADFVEG